MQTSHKSDVLPFAEFIVFVYGSALGEWGHSNCSVYTDLCAGCFFLESSKTHRSAFEGASDCASPVGTNIGVRI